MAGPGVGSVLGHQVLPARSVIEVMVRVDDRQTGFEDILSMALQPRFADRQVVV